MKNEYFQNDVIDLRILGDIGSVCIYRFPFSSRKFGSFRVHGTSQSKVDINPSEKDGGASFNFTEFVIIKVMSTISKNM